MREIKIEISYPGSVISVNHYKFKGRYTKPEALGWMDELGYTIKPYHLEEWKLPLTVRCDGRFVSKRSQPDLSNLSKVTLDAIEEATGVNDRDMRWMDGDVTLDALKDPVLWITITEPRIAITITQGEKR